MANTYTLISSVTVGAGGASTIDFTSIPSTYTDLLLVTSCRDTSAATEDFIHGTFNNDSGANYSGKVLRGNGSGAASGGSGTTWFAAGQTVGSGDTANTFTNSSCYIPNYTGSTQKSVSLDTVAENNATSAYDAIVASLWTGTAAINRITLVAGNSGNFAQYSTAYLYGIKNS